MRNAQPLRAGRISFLGQKITAEAQRAQRKDGVSYLRVLCVSAVQAFRPHREMRPSSPHYTTPPGLGKLGGMFIGRWWSEV